MAFTRRDGPGSGGSDPGARPPAPRRAPLTVLFLDPDQAAAERLAAPLRTWCVVGVVPSAAAATAAMQQRIPDLIVTDLNLPDVNGVEFLSAIHGAPATHNVLLIVVTARASIGDKIAAFQAGADDFLVKPLDPETFEMHVKSVSRFRRILRN